MKNENLLQRIRESKIKGPFKVNGKSLDYFRISLFGIKKFDTTRSKWHEGVFQTANELADHLEKRYLGKTTNSMRDNGWGEYSCEFVNERKTLLMGNLILKLKSLSNPNSTAARENYPDSYIWLKIKPSFEGLLDSYTWLREVK